MAREPRGAPPRPRPRDRQLQYRACVHVSRIPDPYHARRPGFLLKKGCCDRPNSSWKGGSGPWEWRYSAPAILETPKAEMLTKFETKSNRVKGLSFHPKRCGFDAGIMEWLFGELIAFKRVNPVRAGSQAVDLGFPAQRSDPSKLAHQLRCSIPLP